MVLCSNTVTTWSRPYLGHLDQLGLDLQVVEGQHQGLPGLYGAQVSGLEAHLQKPQDACVIDLHHQVQEPASDPRREMDQVVGMGGCTVLTIIF